jgi:hypothetical protein
LTRASISLKVRVKVRADDCRLCARVKQSGDFARGDFSAADNDATFSYNI